jgi:Zn-dependent protease
MGASLNIGKPFGIEIKIHWSFWLVVFWAGSEGVRWSGRWQGVLFAILAILLFFAGVLLHELGHALAAKALNVEVRGITLLPVGGMAKIQNMPEHGWEELVIALAGPMANVGIALALLMVLLLVWGPGLIVGFTQSAETVLSGIIRSVFSGGSVLSLTAFLIVTNLLLAVFNLLPAFPMDGGRIFRASLAMLLPYQTATRIAVRMGQVLALVTIFFTLTPYFQAQSLSAVLLAVFIFVGATYEDKVVQMRWRLNNLRVVDVMSAITPVPLSPGETLGTIMERVFKSPQLDLPVMVQGGVVGMLRRDDLILALRRGESHLPVSKVMRTDYPSVLPTDSLQAAQRQMLTSQFTTLPVLHNDKLVGLINIRDVNGASAHFRD